VTSGKENRARDRSLFSWATNRTIIVQDSSIETDQKTYKAIKKPGWFTRFFAAITGSSRLGQQRKILEIKDLTKKFSEHLNAIENELKLTPLKKLENQGFQLNYFTVRLTSSVYSNTYEQDFKDIAYTFKGLGQNKLSKEIEKVIAKQKNLKNMTAITNRIN
jgi:hypothetical protein